MFQKLEKHPLVTVLGFLVVVGGVAFTVTKYFADERNQRTQDLAQIEKATLQAKVDSLEKKLGESDKRVLDFENQLQTIKATHSESGALAAQNKKLTQEIELLRSKSNDFSQEMDILSNAKVKAEKEADELFQQLKQRDTTIANLHARNGDQPHGEWVTVGEPYRVERFFPLGSSFVDELTGAAVGISSVSDNRVSGSVTLPNGTSQHFILEPIGVGWRFKWRKRNFLLVIAAVVDKNFRVVLSESADE